MRRELYRVWIISHCCSKVSHKPTSRCFVLITMQVEAFLSARRTNRVFQSCFVHVFQTTTLGTGTFVVVLTMEPPQRCLSPMWWFGWLEDELMVVDGGYAAFGGSAEGGERIARERHGPAQPAAGGNGAGQWHDAPGHAGIQALLLAFHHIEGAIERNDDLAFMVESITGRAFAVCIAIRRGGRFLFRSMSTATAAAGTGLGTIASARLSRVGTNIVRHGNSNRLGE